MKIGVITFHRTTNYGAVLQSYALQKVLDNLNIDNEIIDYRCVVIEKRYEKKQIKYFFSPKHIAKIFLRNSYILDNRVNFQNFVTRYIRVSDEKYSVDNIASTNSKYNQFIIGSDQVWNYECTSFDTTYFLEFVNENGKKNSYAASFGVEYIPKQYIEKYRTLLKEFNNVSIREQQGCELYKSLVGRECKHVLDPTFLLGDEWHSLIGMKKHNNKYVLVYVLKETAEIFRYAKKVAKSIGADVIYINDRLINKLGCLNIKKTSVEEWLNLFFYADFVVTNSFHGTAFSINFNRNFAVELLPSPSKVNSRIEDLLQLFSLQDRIINRNKATILRKPDYSGINIKIISARYKSIDFLRSIK